MQKVMLLILDGWGHRKEKKGNAVGQAKTPALNSLIKKHPHTLLKASGKAVGLPKGFIGNSEVGHLTLGAGRITDTDMIRVDKAIKYDLKEVYLHLFLDGRDTAPKSAEKYLRQLQRKIKVTGVGTIATMMGRFYAMDRDNRWGREHKAYECMVDCVGRKGITDPIKALKHAYALGETDEFVKPTILTNKCVVDENDSVIFFNFRSDRARELTRAFVWGRFKEFKRKKIIGLHFVSLTQYDSLVKISVAFPPVVPQKTLGEVISEAGISQLR